MRQKPGGVVTRALFAIAHKLVAQSQIQHEELTTKRSAIDATEFHAIIPINDYPQKARWRVTNKETMVQVSCRSGFVGRFARERVLTSGASSSSI